MYEHLSTLREMEPLKAAKHKPDDFYTKRIKLREKILKRFLKISLSASKGKDSSSSYRD